MTAAKVALVLPSDLLRLAKQEVAAGKAASLSASVAEAVEEKLRRSELADVFAAMDAKHGKPSKAANAWAKRVLGT